MTDNVRAQILAMSRGLAIVLLVVYICSRIFLHNPPPQQRNNADTAISVQPVHANAQSKDPEINPWACTLLLSMTIALMSVTAEFVSSNISCMLMTVSSTYHSL